MSGPDAQVRPSILSATGLVVVMNDRPVLNGVSLSVAAGQPLAVTGPSGAGKSTLCLALTGAIELIAGILLVDGQSLRPGVLRIGYVLQSHGLVTGLTAAENVALPLQAKGCDRVETMERTASALDSVGLRDEAGRLVGELSGGQRQRVGVARALALDPDILIADEPTTELDPDNRQRILSLLVTFAALPRILVVASDDAEVLGAFPLLLELSEGRVAATHTDK